MNLSDNITASVAFSNYKLYFDGEERKNDSEKMTASNESITTQEIERIIYLK